MAKIVVPLVGILVIMIGAMFYYSPVSLQSEYSTRVSVETSDKIENAISNAVSDLEKRDFIPVNLEVRWHPAKKTYVVYVGGIDKTKLSKHEL